VIAVVFFLSAVFPLAAGLAKHREILPKGWGPLDVGIAFLLAILALVLAALAGPGGSKPTQELAYRAYRFLIHGLLAMLIVFFLYGNHASWSNCLTGFVWRTWLILYLLPAWLTVLKSPRELAEIHHR
jgi:hypothetical protein